MFWKIQTSDFLSSFISVEKTPSSARTSSLSLDRQMSLFDEIENNADPSAKEPELIEIERHLRKKKYAGQKEELVKNIPHHKILHTIDESDRICEKCGTTMVRVGEEFIRTEVKFIPAKLKVTDHYRETYECRYCRKKGNPYMEKAPGQRHQSCIRLPQLLRSPG